VVKTRRARRPASRSRRRGATLEDAVLRAATDELLAVGYVGLTMDRAQTAQVRTRM
jgi:hypothetical protein